MLTRVLMLLAAIAVPGSAQAAELSPWLGSADQLPFQLDPTTMVAVTFAGDPLQTGTTAKAPCPPATCLTGADTARTWGRAADLPQN
jgi:hypothetical protein